MYTSPLFEIQACIRAIEEDASLREETNFNERTDAIDFIDFHIIDRLAGLRDQMEGMSDQMEGMSDQTLGLRAEEVKRGLEMVDEKMFVRLREGVGSGLYRRSAFRQMIDQYLGRSCDDEGRSCDDPVARSVPMGYDNLDIFVNGLLSDRDIPPSTIESGPEMVFYQKTPVRIVFEMIGRAGIGENDVFFDIGSGLGQVAILIHLISGAVAKGVEHEPAYCAYAEAVASRLNLHAVEFFSIDARKADYSPGTIFFLYTPFEGGLLREVLDVLQKEAAKRAIRIFTYGPCSSQIAGAGWLTCVEGNGEDNHTLYEFTSVRAAERIRPY